MTVTLSKPVTAPPPAAIRWGVEFAGSASPDHVTASADEAEARRFLRGLVFCGNRDARLMTDDGHGWHPADTDGGTR